MWICCTEKGTYPGPLPPCKYASVTWALWDTRLTVATGHNLSLPATAHKNLSHDTEAALHHGKRVKRRRPRGQEGQSQEAHTGDYPGPGGERSNSGRAQHQCQAMQEGNSRVQREQKAGQQVRATRGRPSEAAHTVHHQEENQETGAHFHSKHRNLLASDLSGVQLLGDLPPAGDSSRVLPTPPDRGTQAQRHVCSRVANPHQDTRQWVSEW